MSDIAFFVEDPGAVAFIDGVPAALKALGYTSKVSGPWKLGDLHVDRHSYRAAVVGTAEFDDWFWRLELARRDAVPAIGLVDSCTSVEFRAKGLRYADWIAVPDEETRQAYIARGYDPSRIRACGHPRHDALYATKPILRTGTYLGGVILFATELSSSRDPALDRERRTEEAIERFLAAAKSLSPRPRLVLRLHPKTPAGVYTAFLDDFDGVNWGGDPVFDADLIVGLTSSILDEALILGRSALTVAPPAERRALAGWRHGLIPGATEPEKIAAAIQRLLGTAPDPAAVEAAFPRGGAANVARLIHDAIMHQMPTLENATVRLEPFADRHMTPRYVGWLNEPRAVKYSEQRHREHTLESCAAYRATTHPPHKLWAILAPPYGHVGNLAATVDSPNRTADLAILVAPIAWGRGIGSAAWTLALDWLLGPGGMRKVTAGTMAANEPMLALMKKSGMTEEGRRRGRFFLDGPVDEVWATKERA